MDLNRLGSVDHCLRHLTTAVSTAKLYSVEHTQVRKLCRMAHTSLLEAMYGEGGMSLLRVDEQLAIDEHPLDRSMYIQRFARLLKMNGIGHIKFLHSVSAEELHGLVASLSSSEKVTCSSENMRLGQVEVRHRSNLGNARAGHSAGSAETGRDSQAKVHSEEGGDEDSDLIRVAVDSNILIESAKIIENVSSEELARVMEIYEAVKNNRRLRVVGLSEIVAGFINVFADYADPLLTLVPLRNMDEYTFTHSLNVCLLNLAQATALGIEGQLLHDIGLSAMLHDVGKLFIPEEVLNKPGGLDKSEWMLMQEHPIRGAEYLLDNPGVPRMAVVNAYEHHLRFDLQGYPQIKNEWHQNLCSQITSVSDIYDSLRTKRPYRDPVELKIVLTTIEQLKGTQLHPLLVENFLRLMKKATPPVDK
ncbi:MAG: HD domain-containing protein [Desulfuromonadales bacterium]|nr:HD domain-containing protein [Desulfuromonadales bacterium]